MNRKIKFRAWDSEQKEMYLYGDIKDFTLGSVNRTDAGYIFMQFTGIHDKNGKEIYEGDVVSIKELARSENDKQRMIRGSDYVSSEYIGVITWDNESCDYSCVQQGQTIEDAVGFPRHEQEMKIIGNIYENPELLNHA